MGSSLDRYSGIFHDWKCNSCLDSKSDVGSNSASRQNIRNGLACIYVNVNFAVNTADASCINFRREHRLGIFFVETGIFTSCNFNNDVFFQSQNERENSVSEPLRLCETPPRKRRGKEVCYFANKAPALISRYASPL